MKGEQMATDNPEDSKAILAENPQALEGEIINDESTDRSNAGRPTDYGPEVVNKLSAAIQRSMSITEACHYAGISRETYYNWLEKYPEFVDKMELAKTYLFRKSKDIIADDITNGKSVPTAKWFLERRDADFKAKQATELSGTIEVTNEHATLKEIAEQLRNLKPDDNTGDTTEEATDS